MRESLVADVYLGERMTRPDWAPAVTMPESAQSALAGTWWSPLTDEIVRLEWREGALRQVGSPAAFVPVGNDTFRPGESRARWQFVAARSAAGLNDHAGEYRSGELETTYTVRVAAGKHNVTWPRGHEMALDAVWGDRFVGSRGTVTFTRDPVRRIDGLTVSNRRLRRFRAERFGNAPQSSVSPAQRALAGR